MNTGQESIDDPLLMTRGDFARVRGVVHRTEAAHPTDDESAPTGPIDSVAFARMTRINPSSSEPGQVWMMRYPIPGDLTGGFSQLGQEWLNVANDFGVGWLGETPFVDSPMLCFPGIEKHIPLWQIPRMRFLNSTQETILPHHLVRLYGPVYQEGWREGGGTTTTRKAMRGGTPNTYGTNGTVWVNGETAVKSGDTGTCYHPLGYPICAAYDPDTEDIPEFGQRWGPRSGETTLRRWAGGFMILGVIDSDRKLASVIARPAHRLIGKSPTGSTWSRETVATVKVYHGPPGTPASMADSGDTVEAVNYFGDIPSNRYVGMQHAEEGDYYEVIAAYNC